MCICWARRDVILNDDDQCTRLRGVKKTDALVVLLTADRKIIDVNILCCEYDEILPQK